MKHRKTEIIATTSCGSQKVFKSVYQAAKAFGSNSYEINKRVKNGVPLSFDNKKWTFDYRDNTTASSSFQKNFLHEWEGIKILHHVPNSCGHKGYNGSPYSIPNIKGRR